MNVSFFSGRICSVPLLKVMNFNDRSITICTFSLAVGNDASEGDCKDDYSQRDFDFIECVAFNEMAQFINSNFFKGAKILCRGVLKNHFFLDTNKTRHFTQVFAVDHAEFGDSEAVFSRISGKRKSLELAMNSDLNKIQDLYSKVLDEGFLCLSEEDYFNIAAGLI